MTGRPMKRLLPAGAILLAAISGAAAQMRVCDGRSRHVDCHFQGGGRLVTVVPPGETLTYGTPTLSFGDRGHVHVVVGNCEIECPPAADAR